LSVFSKDDLLSKNNQSEEVKIKQSKLKSGNLCLKKFLSENFELAKSFPSRQKKLKKCKFVKIHRGP
jgi:hypothetical protein